MCMEAKKRAKKVKSSSFEGFIKQSCPSKRHQSSSRLLFATVFYSNLAVFFKYKTDLEGTEKVELKERRDRRIGIVKVAEGWKISRRKAEEMEEVGW